MTLPSRRFIIGVSGASGGIYPCRLIEALLADPANEVHVTLTAAGWRVLASEMPVLRTDGSAEKSAERNSLLPFLNLDHDALGRLHSHACANIGAGPASGTFPATAMIVVPCSMNTLGAIAHGISTNLLTRAAAVTLKEGRPLVLVPRETPFTLIDLRNMTALAEAGGIILPANPGFYHNPETIEDLVRYVIQKIFDRLNIPFPNAVRWGERSE